MYTIRSISTSELINEKAGKEEPNMEINCTEDEDHDNGRNILLLSKAQTLDRFARPSSMMQHGEKRKKNIFASFRLNKKSTIRKKDGVIDSERETIKEKDGYGSSKEEIFSFPTTNKPRKRYLNRMSSFVSRVTTKVQSGNDITGLKGRLERSQTVTGTDFSPEKLDYVTFDNDIPGLNGIRNHGNTCYINAVIQCLSHTDILAEYFVLDQYKNDLARCNKINSKKYGTKGEITEHLATLLKSLWVLRYVPDISLNLKNIIEKYEPCYRGSNQHDAAEFLMFILDKVHEDLNTASKRKYKKIKNSYGRPDEVVAAETLANHHRCNSSFVQDIFQAQFRSSLKCPHCLKESNTFDPYLCVSIPIPQYEVLSIYITVVYLNQQPKQVKIGVSIEASATMKQLRHVISNDCGICSKHLVLTEVDGEGFHRTFEDESSVNIIKPLDPIYAIEMTPPSSQESSAFIHIAWINVLLSDPHNIRFGGVYQSQVARDVSYEDLQKLLLKEMSLIVTSETLTTQQQRGIFRITVDNGSMENGSKKEIPFDIDLDLPLLHQTVEDVLSICHPAAGLLHIKLILQWNLENKEKYIIDDVDHVDEHSSIDELKKKPQEYAPVTLVDCLQLHTSSEMLSCGDAWHCPTCNRKQQVLKRLTLWSAPQILVVHLKRFRQAPIGTNSSKLNTMVNFPLTGFDISDHMERRSASSSLSSDSGKALSGVWSSWKRSKKLISNETDYVYDLFAVCNHHGRDLQGGHYTAACRNPTSDKWFMFDDFNIYEVAPETVVDQDAYILFYQRREIGTSSSFSSTKDHWSYRIPNVLLPPLLKIIPSNEEKMTPPKQEKEDSNDEPLKKDDIKEEISPKSNDEDCKTPPPPQNTASSEGGSPSSPLDEEKMKKEETENRDEDAETRENATKNDEVKTENDDEKISSDMSEGGDSSPEVIPEVRIQPASLEVLASHRIYPSTSPARASSTSSSASSESSAERLKEFSSGDESTPEVRIGHRLSKISSYVVIRTPSSSRSKIPTRSSGTTEQSPRRNGGDAKCKNAAPSRSPSTPSPRPNSAYGKAQLNSSSSRPSRLTRKSRGSLKNREDLTNGESGYGSHEDNVTDAAAKFTGKEGGATPPASGGSKTTVKGPSKYSSERRLGRSSHHHNRQPDKKCEKKCSASSKMLKKPNPNPLNSKENLNHYLTESSV